MKSTIWTIKYYWYKKPLIVLIWIAFLLRVISAIFSQGFAMSSEHFNVIEVAQSWVDGQDFNSWLPKNQEYIHPLGISYFYTGLHYLLLIFLEWLNIMNPQTKMLVIRFVHAFFSLTTVYLTYKISNKLTSKKNAKEITLYICALWFMPMISVRNMAEVVSIPFLLAGIYILIRTPKNITVYRDYILAGFIAAIAFSIAYNSLIFIIGIIITLFIQKKVAESFYFILGVIISSFATEGIIDSIFWRQPFAQFIAYISRIFEGGYQFYGTKLWYLYISALISIFFLPVGLFYLFGFIKSWKKYSILFIPTFTYILIHNMFPNREERFLLIIIPFYLIAAIISWKEYANKSKFWKKNIKLHKVSFILFWTFNSLLLIFTSTAYSKKAEVETMVYLSKYKNEINAILLEDKNHKSVNLLPSFYIGKPLIQYTLSKKTKIDKSIYYSCIKTGKYSRDIYSIEYFLKLNSDQAPDYVLFYGDENLKQRVEAIRAFFPYLTFEKKINPSFFDSIIQWLNPINKNLSISIYKTQPDN